MEWSQVPSVGIGDVIRLLCMFAMHGESYRFRQSMGKRKGEA